ncbi:MAG: acyl-CoA dehydrogenase, partial [Streptosporangiaceae bacterium]
DYPIEQYIRDAKIDSLYEGTTAIQALDLYFRKIVRDNGAALHQLLAEITEFTQAEGGNGRLKAERAAIARAIGDIEGMLATMTGYLTQSFERPDEIYRVGLSTNRFLLAFGDLLIGWLLGRQAEVALAALDRGTEDQDFYLGKIAATRFFAATVLPRLTAEREIIEQTSLDLMELPESAF